MKKLSLKNLNLEANEMLQRNQLKTVIGGDYGSSSCACKANGHIIATGIMGDCEYCDTWCYYNSPSSTSWICVGVGG